MLMRRKIFLSDVDITKDEIHEVVNVLKTKWLTQGKITQRFENEWRRYVKCKYACAVSSCTAGLHLALRAVGVKSGDEVIVPSLTFVATVNAVLYVGATPVFADSASAEDFNISPDDIKKKITKKTKAIMVMHYGGYSCEMDEVMKISKERDLFIIEDAAHAHGAEYKGKRLGTIGDIGCFSFFANKNLVTGEGGMAVTNNDKFAEKIKLLRSHGMTTSSWDRYRGRGLAYDVSDLGYSYRFDDVRASLGLVQLRKLNKNNDKRKEIVCSYREKLQDVKDMILPFANFPHKSSYHLFPVVLGRKVQREKFMRELRGKGIQTSIHFQPVHQFSYYKKKFKETNLPVAEDIGKRVVSLPLHSLMREKDVMYIAQVIKKTLEQLS